MVSLSVSVSLLATGMVVLATLVVTVSGRAPLDRTLFEVVSASSTTGLSTGPSAQLPVAGQLVLRRRSRELLYAFPSERPIIG